MRTSAALAAGLTLAVVSVLAACSSSSTTPSASSTNATPQTFAAVAGAPTTLTGSNQTVTLPSVPGVSTVGGSILVSATGTGTAVVTIASSASAGTVGGPPVSLLSANRRGAQDFGGSTTTPLYYVGVTNTGTSPQQVNVQSLTLNTNVPGGQSTGLAHYDPSQPQNGWNQHCAFGNGQVSQNGNQTTYSPNANFTLYPGATLWFAPYTYPSGTTASPTPAPQGTGITPTPAPAPASLTGTYIGTASGGGYLEFSLTQSGSSLSGIYALPPSGPDSGSFGSFSGTGSAGSVSLTVTQQYGGSCGGGTISATAGGNLIYGSFTQTVTPSCPSQPAQPFSVALQPSNLPSISGTYTGTVSDSINGAGTLSVNVTTPGTVWGGTATVNFPSSPGSGGSQGIVGFVTSATSGEFAIIGGSNQSCNPFGTITIGNNGGTLTGSYSNSGGNNNNNTCNGTGTYTINH
jgi:hypothetical protein